jgi:hypothetical protein
LEAVPSRKVKNSTKLVFSSVGYNVDEAKTKAEGGGGFEDGGHHTC